MFKACLLTAQRAAFCAMVFMVAAVPFQGFGQDASMVSGQVMKVDQSANKITIKHGPIKNLGMTETGMTMVFAFQDPQMLKTVKPGDKIKFTAERINGVITVTAIRK